MANGVIKESQKSRIKELAGVYLKIDSENLPVKIETDTLCCHADCRNKAVSECSVGYCDDMGHFKSTKRFMLPFCNEHMGQSGKFVSK